jgi:hypothetical protein
VSIDEVHRCTHLALITPRNRRTSGRSRHRTRSRTDSCHLVTPRSRSHWRQREKDLVLGSQQVVAASEQSTRAVEVPVSERDGDWHALTTVERVRQPRDLVLDLGQVALTLAQLLVLVLLGT